MKVTDPLNQQQLEVLRWIAAGCTEDQMHGNGHKTSAMALHHRKLVRVSRKGGRWHRDPGWRVLPRGRPTPAQAGAVEAEASRSPRRQVTERVEEEVQEHTEGGG
jgi:hypothetical protein